MHKEYKSCHISSNSVQLPTALRYLNTYRKVKMNNYSLFVCDIGQVP